MQLNDHLKDQITYMGKLNDGLIQLNPDPTP